MSRRASPHGGFLFLALRLPLFEIALVLVRLDHVASRIVNADHGIVRCQARRYPKIRRRPTRQETHRFRIVTERRV
jgi:hypothetical protein